MIPDQVPPGFRAALFTDLYELTMAQAYDVEQLNKQAVFELAFRTLPPNRNFAVAAGLDSVLAALEQWRFRGDDLDYLQGLNLFSGAFLQHMKEIRFTGDVYAVPEGTPVFEHEPLLQIVAPLIEAQIVETLILNQVHFHTVAATKASRIVVAAAGRDVVDFGSRRAHGIDAAMTVARACYLAGGAGTSLVAAGRCYGIPVFGTMAHSYIEAHGSETEAFTAFAKIYPNTTLLVDTYDTLEGVRKVIELSQRAGNRFSVHAVRLDSGDLGALARQTRQTLDAAGLPQVKIFASSELDEYQIAALLAAGAPIDGFGVGTKMAVSDDAPHLDMAYKLVELDGRGCTKLSAKKKLYPGRKQVFRDVQDGRIVRDLIGRHDENQPGEKLLVPVMCCGERLPACRVSLADARRHAQQELSRLPTELRQLTSAPNPFPVEFTQQLKEDHAAVCRRLSMES